MVALTTGDLAPADVSRPRALAVTAPRRHVLVPLLLWALVTTACAGGEPDIETGAARAAEPAGGASQVVVDVTNAGDGDDTLVGATSPAAAAVEIHRTEIDDGRAQMLQLEEVEVPAGQTLRFRPGSLHLMLVVPDETVSRGGTFPLVLHFDRSGERTVDVEVVGYEDLVDDAAQE
jgi:periplasmic copper chaperone A